MSKEVWGYQDRPKRGEPDWEINPQTAAVREGLARSGFGETSEALYLTSGFTYTSAQEALDSFTDETDHFLYSRFHNPTVAMFEKRLAAIEGAEHCVATGSGMSRPTKAVFIETPSYPLLEIVDIRFVSDLAHKVGATVIVDNVMASPVLQKPLELGADVVMYSATKHIDGQGRVLAGALLGSFSYIHEKLIPFVRHTGPTISPFSAWVLVKSLETMEMRVMRMAENAQAIAEFLEGRKEIKSVRYPGLASHPDSAVIKKQMKAGGTTIGIEFAGSQKDAFKFMDSLKVIDISNNLGDSKSLITHPASTTHRRLAPAIQAEMGITPSVVRLSVGLEHIDDLLKDITQALNS